MGAVPNPDCWDRRRARGFGEPIPSTSIQRRPCLRGIHHPTTSISMVLLSTTASLQPPLLSQQSCSHGPNTFQPFTSWCPGVPVRAHPPHPFVPAREFFCRLWPPAQGEGRGSVSITVGSWQGWRVPTLLPSGSVPRAASHPAWGPGKRRREMSRSWGSAREGSVGRNTRKPQEKILCILRKCQ